MTASNFPEKAPFQIEGFDVADAHILAEFLCFACRVGVDLEPDHAAATLGQHAAHVARRASHFEYPLIAADHLDYQCVAIVPVIEVDLGLILVRAHRPQYTCACDSGP